MDEISTAAPCLGITCLTATFDPALAAWGGWYFMNGILGRTDRTPGPNWGTVPNTALNLAGATRLRFSVRGQAGGEKVKSFAAELDITQIRDRTSSHSPTLRLELRPAF